MANIDCSMQSRQSDREKDLSFQFALLHSRELSVSANDAY